MKRNFNEIYQEIYKNGVKELTILKRNHNVSILVFFALFILTIIIFITQKRFTPILMLSIVTVIVSLVI